MNEPLLENEHPLITPELNGTDAEKIATLSYWSEVVSLLRSLKSHVISLDNQQAIISAIKTEVDLIDIEINNKGAVTVQNADGTADMKALPPSEADEIIDLSKSTTDMTPMQQKSSIARESLIIPDSCRSETKQIELPRVEISALERLQRAAGIKKRVI